MTNTNTNTIIKKIMFELANGTIIFIYFHIEKTETKNILINMCVLRGILYEDFLKIVTQLLEGCKSFEKKERWLVESCQSSKIPLHQQVGDKILDLREDGVRVELEYKTLNYVDDRALEDKLDNWITAGFSSFEKTTETKG